MMDKYGNLGSTWRLVGRRRLAARRRSGATKVVNATNAVQHGFCSFCTNFGLLGSREVRHGLAVPASFSHLQMAWVWRRTKLPADNQLLCCPTPRIARMCIYRHTPRKTITNLDVENCAPSIGVFFGREPGNNVKMGEQCQWPT